MPEYPTGPELAEAIPQLSNPEIFSKGGQKAVYKATIEGHKVAVKVIALNQDQQDQGDTDLETIQSVTVEETANMSSVIARAQREVAILEQVDSPVLAQLGPLGLSNVQIRGNQWMYFTEEWIEGKTLHEIIRNSSLSVQKVARLGVDLVQAICWLSTRGLVHRDIKPANVMWDVSRSRFVLLDPGIAFDIYGPSLTRFPFTVGTLAYLSPEQMDVSRKRNLDFRSDLFAIGVVLYEAAVGEHPFMPTGTKPSEVSAGILTINPEPVDRRVNGFPTDFGYLISRLLAKEPHSRFRTCDRAAKVIQEVAISLGVQP